MDNIEKYIGQSSEKYYKWLVENHKGTMNLDISNITASPNEAYTYFLTFKKKLPDDDIIIKINDVIVLPEEYVVFDRTEFSFRIKLFNLALEPFFMDNRNGKLTVECDLTFLVKRVADYFKNQNIVLGLPKVKPGIKIDDDEFFPEMTSIQKNAVRNIFNSPLSYVWGAPGTGKTRMVLAFCAYKYAEMLGDKEKILILAPTNVALEQSMVGVLEIFNKQNVPIDCVLRCGVPGHAYYEKYPETCEQANIAMVREKLVCLDTIFKMNERKKVCNSILGINKKRSGNSNLLTLYKSKFKDLKEEAALLKGDRSALKSVVNKLEYELNGLKKPSVLKLFKKKEFKQAALDLEHKVAIAKEQLLSADNKIETTKIEIELLKSKMDSCREMDSDLSCKIDSLIRQLFPNELEISNFSYEKECEKIVATLSKVYFQFPELENMTEDELVAYSLKLQALLEPENYDEKCLVIGMTLDRFFATSFSKVKIKHIFLDEACYANAAKGAALFREDIPLTMLGDHKQLPPVCELDKFVGENKEAFLWAQSSLYCEQLFYKEPKEMHECFKQNYAPDFRYFSKSDLIETHRFGISLANILERHAYKNGFKSVSRRSTQLYCIDASSEKMPPKKRESPSEAQAIKKYLDIEQPENFVILTPYVNQRILIKNTCGLDDDKVMTVHKSQGQEWDTVILSVTDTNNLWFTDSKIPFKKGLEVINTAVSRAKNRLIIVCDKKCWLKKEGQLISDIVKASEPIEL